MKTISTIDKKVIEGIDTNLKLVDEVSNRHVDSRSGLVFVDSKEMEIDAENAIKKFEDPKNQSWGILEKEVLLINKELDNLVRKFKYFYSTNINENEYLGPNPSPQEVNKQLERFMVRIKRLNCVLDPDFTVIKFKDKKYGKPYYMTKAYYINDAGERVRSLSRNIANAESSFPEFFDKLFTLNRKGLTITTPAYSKYKADLNIFDGKINWLVEIKVKELNNFIRTFVMFEFWKLYKEEYDLL